MKPIYIYEYCFFCGERLKPDNTSPHRRGLNLDSYFKHKICHYCWEHYGDRNFKKAVENKVDAHNMADSTVDYHRYKREPIKGIYPTYEEMEKVLRELLRLYFIARSTGKIIPFTKEEENDFLEQRTARGY